MSENYKKDYDNLDCVSVIMSAYNTPNNYLEQSIYSILNQTYNNLEVVIVIDSPDNVEMVKCIQGIALKDARVHIIYNKYNMGLPKSLNIALENTNGNYIARMDTDDIALPNRIENQMRFLVEGEYDLVASKVIKIDELGNKICETDKTNWNDRKLIRAQKCFDCMPHPTWLGKKSLFEKLNGYRDINTCEDFDFLLRAMKVARIGMDNVPYLKYRINPNGISSKNALQQILTASYLSKHRNNLMDIGSPLDGFLKRYLTDEAQNRFMELHRDRVSRPQKLLRIFKYTITFPEGRIIYWYTFKMHFIKRINRVKF